MAKDEAATVVAQGEATSAKAVLIGSIPLPLEEPDGEGISYDDRLAVYRAGDSIDLALDYRRRDVAGADWESIEVVAMPREHAVAVTGFILEAAGGAPANELEEIGRLAIAARVAEEAKEAAFVELDRIEAETGRIRCVLCHAFDCRHNAGDQRPARSDAAKRASDAAYERLCASQDAESALRHAIAVRAARAKAATEPAPGDAGPICTTIGCTNAATHGFVDGPSWCNLHSDGAPAVSP